MEKKSERKVSITPEIRKATFAPKSVDSEERTAEVIFSTGSQVRRMRFFDEDFIEELSLDPKHVRLDRLNNGAPLLNNHEQRDLGDVIGVVESASVDGKQGIASVRFSSREDVEPIFQDVKAGIIRNISVGYRIHKFVELEKKDAETGLTVFRAIDWEPIEISAVTAPADAKAQFRSDATGMQENSCDVVENERKIAEVEEPPKHENHGNDPEPKSEVEKSAELRQDQNNSMGEKEMTDQEKEALKLEAIQAERKRQADIKDAVRKAGLEDSFADELCATDKTVDEVRSMVIDKLAETQKESETRTANANVEIGVEHVDKVKRGVENAFSHKIGQEKELAENGREFAYMSMLDMAREVLTAQGIKTRGLPSHRVADIALNNTRQGHTSSDFPEILANVQNKSLRSAYADLPKTWGSFTREVTVSDFKEISRTQLGDAEALEKVHEKGEIKRGTVSEAAEKYRIETYAKIICFSRQMLVNDDMSAFDRVPAMLAARASDLEHDLVWGIITANAAMSDGNPLYDASHSNLGTAGAPSETTLSEARQLMRSQQGLDGRKINVVPRIIYVPQSLETATEKLLATITPDSSTNVSAFSSSGRTPLQMGVEPRLEDDSASAWYIMASLDQLDMIELARLSGESGPVLESRDGFEVEGMEMKVRLDVGAKSIDYRGLFKNNG